MDALMKLMRESSLWFNKTTIKMRRRGKKGKTWLRFSFLSFDLPGFVIPVPVVWSSLGPVHQVGVEPLSRVQSKASVSSCSQLQNPASKLQEACSDEIQRSCTKTQNHNPVIWSFKELFLNLLLKTFDVLTSNTLYTFLTDFFIYFK